MMKFHRIICTNTYINNSLQSKTVLKLTLLFLSMKSQSEKPKFEQFIDLAIRNYNSFSRSYFSQNIESAIEYIKDQSYFEQALETIVTHPLANHEDNLKLLYKVLDHVVSEDIPSQIDDILLAKIKVTKNAGALSESLDCLKKLVERGYYNRLTAYGSHNLFNLSTKLAKDIKIIKNSIKDEIIDPLAALDSINYTVTQLQIIATSPTVTGIGAEALKEKFEIGLTYKLCNIYKQYCAMQTQIYAYLTNHKDLVQRVEAKSLSAAMTLANLAAKEGKIKINVTVNGNIVQGDNIEIKDSIINKSTIGAP